MSRPDPIQYAERLYDAIRAANFSPISFLSFGNAVKEGVSLRNMPRVAAEPFMRVVGEMLDLEEDAAQESNVIDAELAAEPAPSAWPPADPIIRAALAQPPGTVHSASTNDPSVTTRIPPDATASPRHGRRNRR